MIGGYSSLHTKAGGPRVVDAHPVPDAFAAEVREGVALRDWLDTRDDLDWIFVSPSQVFGAFAAAPATGSYRLGGDAVIGDDTPLPAGDLATAVVDLLEGDDHHRAHVSVAI